jgi:hypothetical protein
MRSQIRFSILLPLAALLLCVAACAGGPSATSPQPTASQKPTPATITAADLARLRWIEGSWRGTGDIEKPFYERYRFENDTTLMMEELADETMSKVNDTTRYELKDGHFSNGRYVATALDEKSITFEPVNAGNSFRWERESENSWKATLWWPATKTAPAGQIVYRLERLPQAKP